MEPPARDRYRSDTLHRWSDRSPPSPSTLRNHLLPTWRRARNSTTAPQSDSHNIGSNQQPNDLIMGEEQGPTITPSTKSGGNSVFSVATEPGPAASQAHTHIKFELESRVWMDTRRRDVLKRALAFAMQASEFRQPAFVTTEDDSVEAFNFASETSYPSAETLHLILNSKRASSNPIM